MVGITLKSEGKAGTRKGRLNYDAGFKQHLAKAACEAGVSIARLALEHGLNANMVHKWRREYLAALAAPAQPVPAQFLPVTLAPVEPAIVDQTARAPSVRVVKPASPRQPTSVAGSIEIKFGGATVRIDGLVEASMLAAILSHFHP
jgi:transposase